jgi:Carboxypeptidase regulatory-like domain
MPKQSQKPAAIRESWRPDSANAEQLANRKRSALRWLITALLAMCVCLFAYLLFEPLFHPTLRLYYLSAGSYDAWDVKPIPYFREDAIRFLSIDGSFRKEDAANEFSLMDSPENVRKYLQRVANSPSQTSDVVLLEISAHPMLIGERPYLKCSNFTGATAENGAVSVEELLNLLDRMPVGVALVCLNLGPSDSQSIGDAIRDDFLYSLNDLMKSRQNPNLWILSSNSPQESSYTSLELRSSVFSSAITTALRGTADINKDARIDLDEFTKFVVAFTQSQVQQESGGNAKQTPILFSTAGNSKLPRNLTAIASTPGQRASFSIGDIFTGIWSSKTNNEDNNAELDEKEAEKAQKEKTWLTEYLERSSARIQELTMDEIEDNIDILPSVLGNKVKKSIGLEEAPPESTYAKPEPEATTDQESVASADTDNTSTATEDKLPVAPNPIDVNRKPIPDMSRLADAKATNLQLLQMAWQFCEYLELTQAGVMRPVDMAPHAWNEFTSQLHGIEERLRVDSVVDSKTIRLQLTSEIVGAYQFVMTGKAQVGKLAKRVSAQMPALALADTSFPSVGMMECLAQYGGPPIPNSILVQTQQLDAALRNETPESFEKWYEQLPSEFASQFVEFFWVQQLASRPNTPWRVTRRVIGLWRQYEKLSSDPLSFNIQLQQSLDACHGSLLEGTRLAIDQIGAGWVDRCLAVLDDAEQAFFQSQEDHAQLRNALGTRNQSLAELRSVLRWRKIASTQLGTTQLDDDIEKCLTSLRKLCELLHDRENCDLSEVFIHHNSLLTALGRLRDIWVEEANNLLLGKPSPSISANWIADSLLSTPFIRSPIRNRLLALPLDVVERSESEIDLDQRIPNLPSSRAVTQNTQRQVRYEAMAAGIVGFHSDLSIVEAYQIAEDVDQFYSNLGDEVVKSYSGLQTSTSASDLVPQLRTLRHADRALRLLPTLNSQLIDGQPVESRLWELEVLQSILRKQDVTQHRLKDALPQEVPFLNSARERLAFLANALSRTQLNPVQQPSRLAIRGTSTISLLTETEASGEVILQNVGKPLNKVWVLLDYDSSALEFEGPPGVVLHHVSTLPEKIDEVRRRAEQQLMQAIADDSDPQSQQQSINDARMRLEGLHNYLSYPVRPEPSAIVSTMGLAAGQVVKIPFKIRRLGPGPAQSKLVWKLIGEEEYLRHEVMIQLPQSERLLTVVDGVADSWTSTDEGLELLLWPNRATEYRFGLRNESGKPRVMSVQLVALLARRDFTLPDGFLTLSASKEIEDLLGPTRLLATIPEVALDVRAEPVWLELQPVGGASGTPPVGEAKEIVPAPIPTNQGLVLVFTEKTTNQKYWRRIATRVRHPRSYIEPTIRFDALAERAEIRFRARNPNFVPDQGIQVVGRILEPLPRGTEMKLEGVVRNAETLVLYTQVPAVSARELTVEIDIDGFPRAFVIKVPCWKTNADLPIVSDFQKIEFVEPSEGLNIGPDEQKQKVQLRIDAIPGAFESKRDYVEVGWDLDRDREFANETTIKFAAERQVDVTVGSIINGRTSLTAQVDDIVFELPPPALKNQRVNLLARLFAGGETIWSKPVEVIADSDPPIITGVEISPSTTFPQGIDMSVRVGVDDAKLSGIASVELLIDSKGVGKFADSTEAPKICVRESDTTWSLSFPTADLKPGRATLFVRATDLVGNKSEDSKSILTIISEQEWKAKLKSATYELNGIVSYINIPLPNAKVSIEDEKGAIVHSTKTDEQGAFRVAEMKPGKYKIVAIGVMKNRPRKAEQSVEIGTQSRPIRLQMSAK